MRALIPLALALLAAAGCAFDNHRERLLALADAGLTDRAADLLDQQRDLYLPRDAVLWDLERGSLALALGDPDTTFSLLEDAERRADRLFQRPPEETVAAWLVSDQLQTYIPPPAEDTYINLFKLLAHLTQGRISGYATVEARRLAAKADLLRDRYLRYAQALDRRQLPLPDQPAPPIPTNDEGRFIESPLAAFCTAVTFMHDDNPQFQQVAARRLLQAIELQRPFIGPVDPANFADLAHRTPDDANLLVVAFSGRAPTLAAQRFGPLLLYTVPIYFELPFPVHHPSRAHAAHLEADSLPHQPLHLVEDIASVVAENHRRTLPLIYRRTLLRAAAKAGLTAALAESARHAASDRDQALAQFGVALAGLFYMAATERADTRSWTFLPGQARVALLHLPPGNHRLRVVYTDAQGRPVHTTPWTTVDTADRPLATVVTFFWH